jgi:hypothetical protein
MRFSVSLVSTALVFSVSVPVPTSALEISLVDTFEDGTTQGWAANLLGMGTHPAPPENVPSGGPAGADDAFLLITALGGSGNGSRLTALNPAQWAGDYLDLGIEAIGMDVRNFGTSDLYLRLEFEDPTAGPPTNIAFSTSPIFLAAGTDWTRVIFPIAPPFLTAGLGSVTEALSNTTILRLYHSSTASFPNPGPFGIPTVVGQLGVDNIQPVPEPTTSILILSGLIAGAFRRRQLARRGGPEQQTRI